ncbi:adenylate cyclase, class 2 [Neorhodopirellula lusitana]|uniref:Adenylate cyclase, class 2 n=1 Tax=Neorhodopirellula lusitana TaxID=445327 RepID=A0ABY1QKL2_9BACT|nr:adenylate cyclase, class 2 [Neorhodopirellula lusitana]
MFEIEMKFRVDDHDGLIERIAQAGGVHVSRMTNEDTYFNHPCRDFVQTGEALRIRREDGVPMVTYKAPKLGVGLSAESDAANSAGQVKAREELEWRLDPGDQDGTSMQRLFQHLGFRQVAVVTKDRRTYRIGSDHAAMTVTVDEVESVGRYAEIECMLPTDAPTDEEVAEARGRVVKLAGELALAEAESRSYLRMLLEKLESKSEEA